METLVWPPSIISTLALTDYIIAFVDMFKVHKDHHPVTAAKGFENPGIVISCLFKILRAAGAYNLEQSTVADEPQDNVSIPWVYNIFHQSV